jgi:hypothetical protein
MDGMIVKVEGLDIRRTLKTIEGFSTKYVHDIPESVLNFKPSDFYEFVKKIPYRPDPEGHELIQRPAYTLKHGGDCDDKTVLVLAYCHYHKIPCGYSLVSDNPLKTYHHIFPFIIDKIGVKIDFDATYRSNTLEGVNKAKWYKRLDFTL